MKKAVSFLLTLALLAGLLSAWAAGPAGTLSVYFYDETAQRYGELTPDRPGQPDAGRLASDTRTMYPPWCSTRVGQERPHAGTRPPDQQNGWAPR